MEIYFKLTDDYELTPINDDGIAYLYRRSPGDILKCKVTVERNYEFLKKLFSLFKLVHDLLPPPEPIMYKGNLIQPLNTLDMTRKFLTVKAGFYDVIGTPDGGVRVEAKSISFNKMNEDEFEKLYSNIIDASLEVLPDTMSKDDLESAALEILSYV